MYSVWCNQLQYNNYNNTGYSVNRVMEDCSYQKWQCELKIDGMHPQNAPLAALFHLKFWQNGGVSGIKDKNKEEDNLRFNLLSRSTNGIKNAGDVFGEWNDSGLAFTLITRQQACKWEVGKN